MLIPLHRFSFLTLQLVVNYQQPERPEGWAESSHGRDAVPAYDLLFDDTVVHRIDIIITPEDHQAMQEDLEKFIRTQQPPPPTPPAPAPPAPDDQGPLTVDDPIWVPVTLKLNDLTWWHVGMRFKGNSSLKSAIVADVGKLAFRLNFDKFEDDYPSIHNQRFYGFKKMTFSNAFKDPSFIRDKLAADIFRRGGVPAARGAFARIYVDFGEGPTYYGLYTMIEDPSDRMLESQFVDSSGNLYKPEPQLGPDSAGATWQDFVEEDYDKKTNVDDGYDDVHAVLDALHADRSNADAWREGLNAVFDVEGFLRWLALNQTMEGWDSYLCIPHNYYLYGDPADDGRLRWIPWDLNEAMLHGSGHCDPPELSYSLLLDEADDSRPLVRYLLDDPIYFAQYKDYLLESVEEAFEVSWVHDKMDAYHALVAPYVVGPDGENAPYTFINSDDEFLLSLDGPSPSTTPLKFHVVARRQDVYQALGL